MAAGAGTDGTGRADRAGPPTSPTIEERRLGPWDGVALRDGALEVVVLPALGGRVVSLRDLRSGREWLTQAGPPREADAAAWSREEAVFAGRESVGWDECLPTVAPCADPLDPQGSPLRDHGDQWARTAAVEVDAVAGAVTTTWTISRWPYRLSRRLALEAGGVLTAEYELVSRSERALPVLWSMHPTFRLEPGTRLELPGVAAVRLTTRTGLALDPTPSLPWPAPTDPDGRALDLSWVGAIEDGTSAKLYATTATAARAVTPDGAALEMTWDRESAPALGVWLSFGGWPPGGPPVHQVALEPTSSPDDDLADAMAHARAWELPAGGTRRWWVRLASGPSPGGAGQP